MALKLNLKRSIFPVEIGDFKFEVDLSDDKAKDFEAKMTAFLAELNELSDTSENEDKIVTLLKDVFNELLGEGAYDQLYDYTKRVDLLAELLEELILSLVSKLPGRSALIEALRTARQTDN